MNKLIYYGRELYHYASPYYDPVKAHEYYEQHKQLKGRSSTAGLNEKGREVARYVKNSINEERDKNIKTESDNTKQEILTNTTQLKAEVTQLRSYLLGLSSSERRARKRDIQKQIDTLRLRNNQRREILNENLKNTKLNLRENAKNTYENELEKIKQDSQYLTKQKRRRI